MVTDTLRALLLERCGYTTIVFEFVGGEHTAKNVMIAAVKRPQVKGGDGSGSGVKGIAGVGTGDSAIEGEGVGEGEGVESKEDSLARAREVLSKIVTGEKAVKAEKKKKFQSISVNEFGDVEEESYTEREGDSLRESEEETQRKLLEIADMIENNDRVARMEEEEKDSAIERRIATVMKTFGVKELKLLDLVLGSKDMKHSTEPILVKSGITETPTALGAEEEKKIKKQLKMRKFRR
jgi:hypothetical protein